MNKNKSFKMRTSESLWRKLEAICKATGKTKTAVVEDLIFAEYENNKKYEQYYLAERLRKE